MDELLAMDTNYAEICRFWLKRGLKKPGKRVVVLAQKLGISRTTVYKLCYGEQPIKTEQLPIIAAYIGEPMPPIPGAAKLQVSRHQPGPLAMTIEIEREIGVGTWFEDGQLRDTNVKTIPFVKDPNFPNAQYHAYRLKGDSMDDVCILDGDILFCVAYEDTADTPLDSKAVVI